MRPEQGTGGAQCRSAKGMGFGEGHCTSSPTWRLGGIVSRKILNCNTKICAFLSILHQPLCQIICTASTLSAIYNNENNYDKLLGDIRYSIHSLPNTAGDAAPASPVALTPVHYTVHMHHTCRDATWQTLMKVSNYMLLRLAEVC